LYSILSLNLFKFVYPIWFVSLFVIRFSFNWGSSSIKWWAWPACLHLDLNLNVCSHFIINAFATFKPFEWDFRSVLWSELAPQPTCKCNYHKHAKLVQLLLHAN